MKIKLILLLGFVHTIVFGQIKVINKIDSLNKHHTELSINLFADSQNEITVSGERINLTQFNYPPNQNFKVNLVSNSSIVLDSLITAKISKLNIFIAQYLPPSNFQDTIRLQRNKCEDFQNHGPSNPHLTANTYTKMFEGDLISEFAPEYRIFGYTGWLKMKTICQLAEGSKLYVHRYEYPANQNAYYTVLRSAANCQEYTDVRPIRYYADTLRNWIQLPNLRAITNVDDSLIIMGVNSDLHGVDTSTNAVVYSVFTKQFYPSLRFRINGGAIRLFDLAGSTLYRYKPSFIRNETPNLNIPKDFIIDVSRDNFQTAQRFNVYRTYLGGHYNTISTMTRHDNHVFVTAQVITRELDQILVDKSTGKLYYSDPKYGSLFDLGVLPNGSYQFELRTYNNLPISEDIYVEVKRPN
jgi:hypothetical protein